VKVKVGRKAGLERNGRDHTRVECAPPNGFQCAFFVLLIAAFFVLNGCKAFEIRTQSNTLSESGFLARVPETPRQREAYAALPPYRLYKGFTRGEAFYAYKDEKNGVVYLGSETDYQLYMQKVRRLVAFYETTEDKMRAYDMESGVQSRWHGSWDQFGSASSGN
jgi:hypothetical protein